MKKLILFTFLFAALVSCKNKETKIGQETANEPEKSIQQQIAVAHGLNNFTDVEEIQFTFNVKVQDSLK